MNWVLLHGFVGSSEDFSPLRRALGDPANVRAPDWPGHGVRSGLRSATDYTLEAHLRIVDQAVTSVGSGPVVLLGYSLGGRILQHWLSSRQPTLPHGSRIVLVSTSPGIASSEERTNRQAGDAAVGRLLREEGMQRFLHYWHWQTMFQPLMRLPREQLAPILHRRSASDPEGLALSLAGVGAGAIADTKAALSKIQVPVTVVAGELDPRYVQAGRDMQACLTSSELHLIPETGHAVHLEAPDALAQILRRALSL